ncbi:MAG: FAD-binding oxidoreductase [Rhodobacteraceae bacterium]|nr:FAD-binding oxidoreductase [Paracoccaceae bacterium]
MSSGIFDLEIVGMGVFGLSIAWECSKRGARVSVVDHQHYQRSSSYGLVGALTPHVPEPWESKKQFQFDSLLMAEDWWKEVYSASDIDPHYCRCGRLQPIMDKKGYELAKLRSDEAQTNWKRQAEWKIVRTTDCSGWKPKSPIGWLIADDLSARINPRMAIKSLRKALVSNNVPLMILNGQEETKCEYRVLATGTAGLISLSSELGLPLVAHEKGQAMLIDYDASDQPIITGGGVNLVPQPNGLTAVGSTTERYFTNPYKTDYRLNELYSKAIELVPEVGNSRIVEKWAHDRPRSVTRAPVLGAHPTRENTFLANGGFKIGFGLAPKIAEVMAELILNGNNLIPHKFSLENAISETVRQKSKADKDSS